MIKRLIGGSLLLFVGLVALASWPLDCYYSPNSEGNNVRCIKEAGYHLVMKQGKVYEFKFKDGTIAHFLLWDKRSSSPFKQVSEAEYENNPGDDSPDSVQSGGGGGFGGGSGGGSGQGIFLPVSYSSGSGGGGDWFCWATDEGVACTRVQEPSFNPY